MENVPMDVSRESQRSTNISEGFQHSCSSAGSRKLVNILVHIGKFSNFRFKWTKTLHQNNSEFITGPFMHFLKATVINWCLKLHYHGNTRKLRWNSIKSWEAELLLVVISVYRYRYRCWRTALIISEAHPNPSTERVITELLYVIAWGSLKV